MFGMEMALEALGINSDELKAQVAAVVTTAANLDASQKRIEAALPALLRIEQKLDWIISLAPSASQAAEPQPDPAQTALNLETTQNAG